MVSMLMVLIIWLVDRISDSPLILEVPVVKECAFLKTKWLYFYVLAFSFFPVFFLSFDKRVHYYTNWKKLFPVTSLIAFFFIIWDVLFTKWRVWGFNEKYHQDYKILGLPIEEILFFFVIPFACVFIYKCLAYYCPKDWLAPYDKMISLGGGGLLLLVGIISWDKIYTSTTFLLTGSFLIFHYLKYQNTYRTRFYFAYLISWVPFLIVDGVLTGGYTVEPVVIYHPEEFLNFRITSVPFEDSIYGLLLLFLNVWGIEKIANKNL